MQRLINVLKKSRYCVIFTGAGVSTLSTASGVLRGKNGIYKDKEFNPDKIFMLCSSLVVYPAASLPVYTVEKGNLLIIINDLPTLPDSYAELRYDDLGSCFEYIRNYL